MLPKHKECIVTVTIRVDLSTEEIETGNLTMLKKDLESEVSCCWHGATVDNVTFVRVNE